MNDVLSLQNAFCDHPTSPGPCRVPPPGMHCLGMCIARESILLNHNHDACASGTHCMEPSVWLKCDTSKLGAVRCQGMLISLTQRHSRSLSSKSIYKPNTGLSLPSLARCCHPSQWGAIQLGTGPCLSLPSPWLLSHDIHTWPIFLVTPGNQRDGKMISS